MQMNQFTAEMLLGNFFDEAVLARYAVDVLGKSGKGKAATLSARIVKVWERPDFQCVANPTSASSTSSADRKSSGNNKRKREQGDINVSTAKEGNRRPKEEYSKHADGKDDGDWKRPLFYWKGDINLAPDTQVMQWEGSWSSDLASKGLPDADEYDSSKKSNAFKLTSKIADACIGTKSKSTGSSETTTKVEKSEVTPLNSLIGKGGSFKGSYLLDQGDGRGPRKFRDLTHHFAFDSCIRTSGTTSTTDKDKAEDGGGKQYLLITASGSTEFGDFVSAGYAHYVVEKSASEKRIELILARRYIADDDSRNLMVERKTPHLLLNTESPLDVESELFWAILLPRDCS